MLKELSIRNFAIIDDLQIEFSNGLTVLSGETGAGKSIILNAVNLLLGTRASADLVRTGAETAELEALFRVSPDSTVAGIMTDNGYDPADGLLIRRLISRTDSNRVYVNGRMATISLLNTITENLASISGQHAHQGLLHLARRVLKHRHPCTHHGSNGSPPGLAELEGGIGVARQEHLLHGQFRGAMVIHQFADVLGDDFQPFRERGPR